MPNVSITIYLNARDYNRYLDNRTEINKQTREYFLQLMKKDNKLSEILTKEEINNIKIELKKKINNPATSWAHAVSQHFIEGMLTDVENIQNPKEIHQLAEFIKGKIAGKLKKYLKKNHPEQEFIFD